MKEKYKEWITNYNQSHPDTYGLCAKATKEFLSTFPELKRVRGHVESVLSTKQLPHWWCVDSDGEIVDPTAKQFGYISKYIEWDETQDEPTGKCPNCGELCYDYRFTCCDSCASEYADYVSGSVRFG